MDLLIGQNYELFITKLSQLFKFYGCDGTLIWLMRLIFTDYKNQKNQSYQSNQRPITPKKSNPPSQICCAEPPIKRGDTSIPHSRDSLQ